MTRRRPTSTSGIQATVPVSVTSTVSPMQVAPGATATIGLSVTSAASMTALVSVEISTAGGSAVSFQELLGQAFVANQPKPLSVTWAVPSYLPPSTYSVTVGVVTEDWASAYYWNDQQAMFAVTGTPRVAPAVPAAPQKLFGASIDGAGGWADPPSELPGVVGKQYIYPLEPARLAYLMGQGLTLVRLPFRWERLQASAFGALSAQDLQGLRGQLDATAAVGGRAILSMENWGRYYGAALTGADAGRLADVWSRIAQAFRGHPALWGYEIMRQPYDLPGGQPTWGTIAQATVNAIRAQDTLAYVLVAGYDWAYAGDWDAANPTLQVADSANRLLYAASMAFDADHSDQYAHGFDVAPTVGVDRLQPFLTWLSGRGARGIITHYGVPDDDPRWLDVLDRFLAAVDAAPQLVGGTYWACGPWSAWSKRSIEPGYGPHRPQVAVLSRHPSR